MKTEANRVLAATLPEECFGDDITHMPEEFRKLARKLHPDVNGGEVLFVKAFQKLNELRSLATTRFNQGVYGTKLPTKGIPSPYTSSSLSYKGKTYKLISLLGSGMVSEVHEIEGSSQFLKIAKHPRDNDLLASEFWALTELWKEDKDPNKEKFFNIQRVYTPKPIHSFTVKVGGGSRQVNILEIPKARVLTLSDVQRHFRGIIPNEHLFWITRRTLLTLYMCHLKGIVHGGITPDNLLVAPKAHGTNLIGWTTAGRSESHKVPYADSKYFIPTSIAQKKVVTTSVDLEMLGETIIGVGDLPPKIQTFLRDMDKSRLQRDPLQLHDELGILIEKTCGPRKYVELDI